MKSIKKILSLVIALAMVLSIAPLVMAETGDGGSDGGEQVLLNETFEGVSGVTFPYKLPADKTGAFKWTRNTDTSKAQEYIFENDGTNTYMSFYNPNSTKERREANRKLDSAIPSGSVVSVKLKFKYDSGVKAYHGFEILGHKFYFRTEKQGFYADSGQYWTPTYTAMKPNVWNDIEILLFPATETENAKFQYYLGGTFIVEGKLSDLVYTGTTFVLAQQGTNTPTMGTKKIYYDDIIVTAIPDVPYAYSVVDLVKDAGCVSGVTIKKHKHAKNAVLIAAVYDGGKLTKASAPIDVTGALINRDKTYTLNLPIANDDTEVRVFVLDKTNLTPLALDKTY